MIYRNIKWLCVAGWAWLGMALTAYAQKQPTLPPIPFYWLPKTVATYDSAGRLVEERRYWLLNFTFYRYEPSGERVLRSRFRSRLDRRGGRMVYYLFNGRREFVYGFRHRLPGPDYIYEGYQYWEKYGYIVLRKQYRQQGRLYYKVHYRDGLLSDKDWFVQGGRRFLHRPTQTRIKHPVRDQPYRN